MWRMAGTSYGPLSRSDSRGASTPVPSGSSLLQPAVLSLEEHEGRAVAGGDDGHAGGKEAHHPAQLLRVEHAPPQSAGVYAMRIRLPSLKPARNFSSKRAQPSGYLRP